MSYFSGVVSSHPILLQILVVTFQMLFINSIANILSRFGPILKIYWSNLQNGKQNPAENLDLIEDSYWGLDRAMETGCTFGSAQSELLWFSTVWAMEIQ